MAERLRSFNLTFDDTVDALRKHFPNGLKVLREMVEDRSGPLFGNEHRFAEFGIEVIDLHG